MDSNENERREEKNVALVRAFFRAVEQNAAGDELKKYLHEDVVQEEKPNRLVPNGKTRGLADIQADAEKGKKVLRAQSYEIQSIVAQGPTVIAEVVWRGTLAVQIGALAPGDEMRGHIAFFIEIEDGRIRKQREYSCFEPF